MSFELAEAVDYGENPLEVVERVVSAAELTFERCSNEDLAAEYAGRWGRYQLWFAVRHDIQALHFSCGLDIRVPEARHSAIYPLLARINEQLWLGHFDLWHDEGQPTWRHSVIFRDGPVPNDRQIADIVGAALDDCERYYPAFRDAVETGAGAEDALAGAITETMGEA